MKKNSVLFFVVGPCVLLLVGAGLGQVIGDEAIPELFRGKSPEIVSLEKDKLVLEGRLIKARQRLQFIREQLQLSNSDSRDSSPKAAGFSEVKPTKGKAATAEQAKLQAELLKLKELVAKARRGEVALTEKELAAKIADLKAKFAKTLAAGKGEAALAILKELSKLGEDGFPTLAELWAKLDKENWPGVGRRGRMGMGWGSPTFFKWALSNTDLGISEAQTNKLQASAVFAIAMTERDPAVRTETYVNFLKNKKIPAPLTDEQKKLTGFARFQIYAQDPYRAAIGAMSRRPTESSVNYLSSIAIDPDIPADIKVSVLYGLADSDSESAKQAIDQAAFDEDPEVQQAAELAQQQSEATVTGLFVISVERDGAAAKAGVVPGDIITSYNGQAIYSMREVFTSTGQATGEVVMIIVRGGVAQQLKVKGDEQLRVMGKAVTAPSSDD